ncbi:hypothetical protein ABZY45_35055, partial [Streptomyces sp. NPDC006516]|uniref:hypothetical protein n=1 Tax=Streptomyces sp. NPDC006516 TaxID=3154309 RepID=UPI0033AD7773
MSELLPQLENLSAEQQAMLRLRLRQIKDQASRPEPMHALFSERARAFPDRVAVVFGDVELSYGALERWS